VTAPSARTRREPPRRRRASAAAVVPPNPSAAAVHAVYEIAPGLLLVFKPRGHREPEHEHAHRQRLLVLRGRLVVRTARGRMVVSPLSGPLVLPAGRRHSTEAPVDTWLVAEALSATRGRSRR